MGDVFEGKVAGGEESGRSLRLLLAGDLHGSDKGLAWFYSQAEELRPELIVFVGDFVTGGPLSYVRNVLASLRQLAPQCFVIPGNWDPRESLVAMDEAAFDGLRNLHKSGAWAGGYSFAGLGGSTPTSHGGSPFEVLADDETFADPLRPWLPADVWVLHNPVHGFRDRVNSGSNAGSEALLALLREQEAPPRLVLSGHIHEARGVDTFRGTTYVNAGPLSHCGAALIQLRGDEVTVDLVGGEAAGH